MATIGKTARYVRSKNAGPFWLTIDVFCYKPEDTHTIAKAFERNRQWIAQVFQVEPDLLKICPLPDIKVTKLSLPRNPIQGSRDERDMHGGQQYVTLLDIEV